MCVFFAFMYVCTLSVCSVHRPEEGIRFPRTRVVNSCELPLLGIKPRSSGEDASCLPAEQAAYCPHFIEVVSDLSVITIQFHRKNLDTVEFRIHQGVLEPVSPFLSR